MPKRKRFFMGKSEKQRQRLRRLAKQEKSDGEGLANEEDAEQPTLKNEDLEAESRSEEKSEIKNDPEEEENQEQSQTVTARSLRPRKNIKYAEVDPLPALTYRDRVAPRRRDPPLPQTPITIQTSSQSNLQENRNRVFLLGEQVLLDDDIVINPLNPEFEFKPTEPENDIVDNESNIIVCEVSPHMILNDDCHTESKHTNANDCASRPLKLLKADTLDENLTEGQDYGRTITID